jgi:hypothetical protein
MEFCYGLLLFVSKRREKVLSKQIFDFQQNSATTLFYDTRAKANIILMHYCISRKKRTETIPLSEASRKEHARTGNTPI